jgi:hypothetical protein
LGSSTNRFHIIERAKNNRNKTTADQIPVQLDHHPFRFCFFVVERVKDGEQDKHDIYNNVRIDVGWVGIWREYNWYMRYQHLEKGDRVGAD